MNLPIDRLHSGPATLLWAALLTGACSEPPPSVAELSGPTMGTTYSVKLFPAPDAATAESLRTQIDARLEAINRQRSTYLPDSDLSRFNRSPSTDWQPVPAELGVLVARAQRISAQTDGAYDVTVSPLVELWGFGSQAPRDTPPTSAAIAERLQLVGFRKLQARDTPPALRKQVAGLQVDLSSIAKGWAVDQLADLVEQHGVKNYLVEIGGEVFARGDKGADGPWRIAVEKPLAEQRDVHRAVAIRNLAVATSGDYRNFFEEGGQRYSHTLDPLTGLSVRQRLAAVTVFAANCTDADAWATALLALGEKDGRTTADRLGIMALFITRDEQDLVEFQSAALRAAGHLDHDQASP